MAPRLLQFARAVSLCHGCVHLEGGNPDGSARCAAFDTIPAAIWTGAADHRQPITGDRGITFQAAGAYGEALEAAWSAQRLVASATLADEDAPDADEDAPEAPGGGDEQEDSPGPVNGDSAAMEDAPEEEWHAVVVVEGVETGDRRFIEAGALSWRELPLPISWQTESPDHGGHAHSVEVARITRWERRGGELHAWGHHIENAPLPAGTPSFREYLEEVGRAGLSADLDDADIEIDWPDEDESDDEMVFPEPELVRVVAARVSGATVVTIPAFQEAYIETLTPAEASPEDALVAAAAPQRPPAAWFEDPGLTGPTPLTVTDDGRVFGHLATWGTCHTGFQGSCVTPPHEDEMAYFHTGEVTVDSGERVAVGQITLGTGHADGSLSPELAAAHYDHTGTAVADIATGPDAHGIWMAGAVRPGLTADDVRVLRAAAVSGDWRRIGTALRLVAVLSVNVPGFPVPRTAAHLAAGAQRSLVAAGVVRRREPNPLRVVADHLAARVGRSWADRADELAQRLTLTEFACGSCGRSAAQRRAAARAVGEARGSGAAPRAARTTSYEVVTASGQVSGHESLIDALRAKRSAGRGAVVRSRVGG